MKILVAYASKYGSTQKIAERVGTVLSQSGLAVTVCAADDVRSVRSFDAVVVGSPICSASWLPEAEEFLESFQDDLAKLPVWLFSDTPTTEANSQKNRDDWSFSAGSEPAAAVVDRQNVALFTGKSDEFKLGEDTWFSNCSANRVAENDRNWQAVDGWGEAMARALLEHERAVAEEQQSRFASSAFT